MIPLPFWLTNAQFVISAFGAFAFFSAAWLNIDSWAVRREVRTGFRALGFTFLAIWSGLHGIGAAGIAVEIVSAAILLGGTLSLLLSFIFDKLPMPPKELMKFRKQQENLVSKDEMKKMKKEVAPVKKEMISPEIQEKPMPARKARAVIKSAAAERALPGINAGLSSNAFLKLPKKKRSGLIALLNTVVGLIVLVLIGWGSYIAYQNWFGAKDDQDFKVEETNFIEMDITTETPEEEVVEEDAVEETTEEEVVEEKKPTVTIEETELGYLNVRAGSGIIHELITTIAPGDTLELLDEERDWYEVQIDENTTGWISSRYATKNE